MDKLPNVSELILKCLDCGSEIKCPHPEVGKIVVCPNILCLSEFELVYNSPEDLDLIQVIEEDLPKE